MKWTTFGEWVLVIVGVAIIAIALDASIALVNNTMAGWP